MKTKVKKIRRGPYKGYYEVYNDKKSKFFCPSLQAAAVYIAALKIERVI